MKADADLIAAGLLLDLKTESKLSLGVTTVFQVIGYALLDFDDAYELTSAGTFSARYAYLATWNVGELLDELAGCHVDLPSVRREFRQLLLACQLAVPHPVPGRPAKPVAGADDRRTQLPALEGAGLGHPSPAPRLATRKAC
jgi:hypothetical protein